MEATIRADDSPPGIYRIDLLLMGLSVLTGYLMFFIGYDKIDQLIWDETYHISSAYKYLNGQFFLEPHPPLGKMLIAVGELILNPNPGLSESRFWIDDTISSIPDSFNYTGVRLIPVILSALCPALVYLITRVLTKDFLTPLLALGVFTFETALQAQFRAAMLDGMQLFFCLLSILYYFLFVFEKSKLVTLHCAVFGLLVGLAASIKVNSLFLIVLPLYGSVALIIKNGFGYYELRELIRGVFNCLITLVLCCSILSASFIVHYNLTYKTYENGMYGTKDYVQNVNNYPLVFRPIPIISGNFEFMARYQKGVPKLKVGDPSENGSLAMVWPFGYKPISYRWDYKVVDGKPRYSYLYFLPNPISHWLVIITILMVSYGFLSNCFHGRFEGGAEYALLGLFVAYMVGISLLDRVMYSYHYIPAFTIGVLIFALEFHRIANSVRESMVRRALSMVIIVGCCATFWIGVYEIIRWVPLASDKFNQYESVPFFDYEPKVFH